MEGGLLSMSDRIFSPLAALDAPDLQAFQSDTEPTEVCLVNLLEAKIGRALTPLRRFKWVRDEGSGGLGGRL